MAIYYCCFISFEARFDGVRHSLAEPLDLRQGDARVAEEVKHGVKLDQAEEQGPEVALVH